MAKWRLVILSLPFALLVDALRWLVHNNLGLHDMLSFADAGPIVTGAALIMGLMLGGVLGDYKESEKIPAAVAGNLVAVELFATRGLQAVDKDNSWVRPRVAAVAHVINDWWHERVTSAQLWAAADDLNQLIVDVSKSGATVPYVNQLHGANNGLGGALDRADWIRKTSFIKSGYALLEFLTAVVLLLMVIAQFPDGLASWLVPAAISMVYVFMVQFIKDLDNPFGYADNNGKGSAADVDLAPWEAVYSIYK